MKPIVRCVGVVVLIAAGAVEARAQMTMGSFKGYLTGHLGAVSGGDISERRLAGGASVAVHEPDGWGAELDFGRATGAVSGSELLDVTTYFVNALWVRPSGLVRPFGGVGAGILQINGCAVTCALGARTNDLGLGAGGGAFVVLNDVVGVRADARYLFSAAEHPELRRPDGFGFWRASIGVTFMWAVVP